MELLSHIGIAVNEGGAARQAESNDVGTDAGRGVERAQGE